MEAICLKITVFLYVKLSSLVEACQDSGGNCCLSLCSGDGDSRVCPVYPRTKLRGFTPQQPVIMTLSAIRISNHIMCFNYLFTSRCATKYIKFS